MDNLSPEHRRKNMRNIRSKRTQPELTIFQEMKKRKIYFAPHVNKIVGKPDLVFRRKKVVVFIDSDFWHGHPDRYPPPKSNTDYWQAKVERNRRRDVIVNETLAAAGRYIIRNMRSNSLKKEHPFQIMQMKAASKWH